MSDPESHPPMNRVNAFLDGLLTPSEQEEFARRVANDVTLRAELSLQQRISRQLQTHFQPPVVPPVDLPVSRPSDSSSPARNGKTHRLPRSANRQRPTTSRALRLPPGEWAFRGPLLGLACGAGLVVIAMIVWSWLASGGREALYRERPLPDVLQETIEYGFQPEHVGVDDQRMQTTFYVRHGQALKLGKLPPDRQVLGISYRPSLSRHTTTMLARVAGQPVMVFVDQLSRDRPLKAPSTRSGLQIFRRQLGDLVMYEVGPFGDPQIIPFLLTADPPPDTCLIE